MEDLNSKGTANQIKGAAKEGLGRTRAAIGDATNNTSESLKGRAQEAEGKIDRHIGNTEKATSSRDDGFRV